MCNTENQIILLSKIEDTHYSTKLEIQCDIWFLCLSCLFLLRNILFTIDSLTMAPVGIIYTWLAPQDSMESLFCKCIKIENFEEMKESLLFPNSFLIEKSTTYKLLTGNSSYSN